MMAYVHVFMAYLKFINREFHWDLSSLLLILQLMQFLVILREFVACCWEYLFHCQNSPEFADFKRDKTLNASEELVFFDVISLFPKILPLKLRGETQRRHFPRTKNFFACGGYYS